MPDRLPTTRPPAAARELVAASARCLLAAERAERAGERYALAHLSALRAAAAVLACRGRPARRRRPASAWDLLTSVAPEFGEWAAFFAAGARKRAAAEAGLNVVGDREAADLVRDAEAFLDLVCGGLGFARRPDPYAEGAQLRRVG